MIDWLNKQGAKVIEVDTDGIYFVPPSAAAGLGDAGKKPGPAVSATKINSEIQLSNGTRQFLGLIWIRVIRVIRG